MSARPSRPLMIGAAGAAALSLALAPMAMAVGIVDRLGADGALGGEAPTDRYETAVGISKLGFEEEGSAQAVVLARSDDYADALAGGPLAAAKEAPLLLTKVDGMPAATVAELERVLADGGTVYVLGGTAAVSGDVVTAVEGLGFQATRIDGDNRYETALAIAAEIGGDGPVLLGTGTDYPDALAAGAAAGSEGGVVLLTNADTLPNAVATYLDSFEGDVFAVGGPAAAAAPDATAIEGEDRYETAVEVAHQFFDGEEGYNGFVLASGQDFPDALAGGASSGRSNDPVLLTQQDNLPDVTEAYLAETSAGVDNPFGFVGFVLGGPAAVSDAVVEQVNAALNPPPPAELHTSQSH